MDGRDDDGHRLTEDVLFLACTRPAMWHGVPFAGAVANAAAGAVFVVLMGAPPYFLVTVAVHYAMRLVVSRDYNMFGVLLLWLDTKGRSRNRAAWGGSSVSPLPLRPARRNREVRVHA